MATDWNRLRASKDYREFLQAYLEERSLRAADFARSAGFGRGFPGDVIKGRRRLTYNTCRAFERAMKIPLPAKKLFRYLAAQEEPNLYPEIDRQAIPSMIVDLRAKSWSARRQVKPKELPFLQKVLRNPYSFIIFAATGEPSTGASFSEIQSRTGIEEGLLLKLLGDLETAQILRRENDRYYTKDLHMVLQSDEAHSSWSGTLNELFLLSSTAASHRAREHWDSQDEFFFSSAVCIQKSKMAELKNALRETILSFVDDCMNAEGDQVIKLLIAMHL